MKHTIILTLLLAAFVSCNESTKINTLIDDLPEKQDQSSLKETDFVATLENTFYEQKNYIYSPTLAFAWNEIKDQLKDIQIQEDKGIRDLMLLNNTESYKKALDKDEYHSEISIEGGEISAKADFNLQFTFEPVLEKLKDPLTFKNTKVKSFGMKAWDEGKADLVEIIYFEDNSNFIFKLKPKESGHELLFIRGLNAEKAKTFQEVLDILNSKEKMGLKERNQKKMAWKYRLVYNETFRIPELAFNLEKSFTNMIGRYFTSGNNEYKINEVKQRNALHLNNNGARIESEAEVAFTAESGDETKHITKHFILDSTFFLIVKHSSRKNPYFCIKIDNVELMQKW